ncbi:MAG: DNA cytosine methyltransferase [Dolichospermum sp.]
MSKFKSLELFTGAGGLAMGCTRAGFDHQAIVERDKHSCHTIRENQQRGMQLVSDWCIHQIDVADFNYSNIRGEIDLLAGGPPCQPFSIGGNHHGYLDKRDMFPEFLRAVRELRPKAFLIENVRGLVRPNFINYFEYILLQLNHPELQPHTDESWADHLVRLEEHQRSNIKDELSYQVKWQLLNAANYGVPQKRERVFIVGFRSDLQANWSFPQPTHTEGALIWDQWVTGEYWERHGIANLYRPEMPIKIRSSYQRKGASLLASITSPWQTVRDAITDLPPPENTNLAAEIPNHIYIPGAKSYPGHTGSSWYKPAKTLKAGVHGVPGGENMLAFPDGQVRYFTVREAARLQTFPDDYYFPGAWGESMRQIGNAVPVTLAYTIATSIRTHLQEVQCCVKIKTSV